MSHGMKTHQKGRHVDTHFRTRLERKLEEMEGDYGKNDLKETVISDDLRKFLIKDITRQLQTEDDEDYREELTEILDSLESGEDFYYENRVPTLESKQKPVVNTPRKSTHVNPNKGPPPVAADSFEKKQHFNIDEFDVDLRFWDSDVYVNKLVKYVEEKSKDPERDLEELYTLLRTSFKNDISSDEAIFFPRTFIEKLKNLGREELGECEVCLGGPVYQMRNCCGFLICDDCSRSYLELKVLSGVVTIPCPGSGCDVHVIPSEIRLRVSPDVRTKYERFLVDVNKDPTRKTCPGCCIITTVSIEQLKPKEIKKNGLKIQCSSCDLVWCFLCQAPWHHNLTCKQFQAKDEPFQNWYRGSQDNELKTRNARSCPNCKRFVQKADGCDHISCVCQTDFCYACGDRMRNLKDTSSRIFGSHQDKFSIFGCKKNFLPHSPITRKVCRGALFGGKVVACSIVGSVAAVMAVGVLPVVAVVGGAIYGGEKLKKVVQKRRRSESTVEE